MFAVHCHVHGSEVLLDWSRIEGVTQTADGPVLDWHCWCGARGRLVAGGRSEPRTVDLVLAPEPADADAGAASSERPGEVVGAASGGSDRRSLAS